MEDFFSVLSNIFFGDEGSQVSAMDVMHDYAHDHGFNLTDEQIAHSVQEASDFFNMDCPAVVRDGWTTGVSVQMSSTAADDILLINRAQMEKMHITDPQAFDLVMTHEGAHRALQGMDTGFTDHQEELCCDTMAGVRAALNDMPQDAIDAMKASLVNTNASESHPGGDLRVLAIDDGYDFAKTYMRDHNGMAPSFRDCLDHFNAEHHIQEVKGLVTLRPDDAPEAVKSYSAEEIEFRMLKIQNEINDLQYHLQHHNISSDDGGLWHASEHAGADAIQERLDAATREYNRWRDEVPDNDIHEYTTNDIDWLAKQVRNSHGMEQAHWLEKLNWAKSHVSGFAATEGLDNEEHGSNEGPSDDSVRGFVNDKGWHLKQAEHEQKEMEYYEKQMNNALKNNKLSSASDYEYKMKMHQKRMQSHLDDAKRSTKLFASSNPYSSGFDAEHPMPSYEQLRNAGFSDHVASSILNPDQPHTYSQRELHDVLYSENPVEAYNQMMSAKAQAHFQRTAELEREINRDFGIFVNI